MQQLWQFWQTVLGVMFHHPVPGVSIIPILDDGRIVLIKRQDNQQWSLPGGMVDWRQDIKTTVKRELFEETGLTVKQMGRLVGVYSAPDRDPRLHSICVAVEAHVQGDMKIVDSGEVLAIQAFAPEDLPGMQLSHDHGQQLEDYGQGKTMIA